MAVDAIRATFIDYVFDGGAGPTFNFVANLGVVPGSTGRRFIACCTANRAVALRSFTSATCNSVSMSVLQNNSNNLTRQVWLLAEVPTGDSVTTSVTWSSTVNRCVIALWRLDLFTSQVEEQPDVTTADPGTLVVDVPKVGGCILCSGYCSGVTAFSVTGFTGTDFFEQTTDTVNGYSINYAVPGQLAHTVECDWTTPSNPIWSSQVFYGSPAGVIFTSSGNMKTPSKVMGY